MNKIFRTFKNTDEIASKMLPTKFLKGFIKPFKIPFFFSYIKLTL